MRRIKVILMVILDMPNEGVGCSPMADPEVDLAGSEPVVAMRAEVAVFSVGMRMAISS